MNKFEGFQKGVNLGGWISQFAKYDPEHFASFITEKDIEYIASLGFDHVRVPVDYNVLEDEEGNEISTGFKYLTDCREWCEKHGLNMLVDLHECYGYSFDPLKADMDRKKFFYDDALQERFLNLWKKIAAIFKDYPDQVAFEPLNEVVLYEVADAWNVVADKYIETVRTIAPNNYIVIGGVNYSGVLSVPLIKLKTTKKIVYNFHCYEPMIYTHQGAYWVPEMPKDFRVSYPKTIEEYRQLSKDINYGTDFTIFREDIAPMGPEFFEQIFKVAIDAAEKAGVPLYCGEYGAIDLSDNQSRINWLKDIQSVFKKFNIGRALWNYKEKDFGFVDDSFAEVQDQFIAVL